MTDDGDGNARSLTVPPVGVMPGLHGGTLRRGGGRMESETVKRLKGLIRDGAEDAIAALLGRARKGDVKAIEMVLAYTIGKPTDKLELSGPDGGPLDFVAGLSDEERRVMRDAIRERLEGEE